MIQNETEYQKAMVTNEEERRRIDDLVEIWKKQGLSSDEVKRLSDPMMSLHLQFVEEAEAWRMEQDGSGIGIEESAGGFAIREPQPGGSVLYYGRSATASRMDMFIPDELFQTRKDAEKHMFELNQVRWAVAPEGCMGPPPPSRDDIADTTADVWATLCDRGLFEQDEESLCQPMAESRRRVLWLLEKAVEEVLRQDVCENF